MQYDIGNDFDQNTLESESSEKKRRKMEKKLEKKRYEKVFSLQRLVALAAVTQPLLTNKATCQFVLFMLKILQEGIFQLQPFQPCPTNAMGNDRNYSLLQFNDCI